MDSKHNKNNNDNKAANDNFSLKKLSDNNNVQFILFNFK